MATKNKNHRGNASQFFVAGELCRRELVAVVTMGNTPNTDILCSNIEGTKFAHIQVKTFVPGRSRSVSVGQKAERHYGDNFVWVLGGIPEPPDDTFEFFIVPSQVMARGVKSAHQEWLKSPGKRGQPHKDNPLRTIGLPPKGRFDGGTLDDYRNRWDIIENLLKD